MNQLYAFFSQHPFIATAITTWLSNTGISAFINALDAPTATSSPWYRFAFKFFTAVFAGNIARATNTKVESSPNFIPAVAKLANGGGELPK